MAHLIDKSALVAEIEKRLEEYRTYPDCQIDSNYMELCDILSFLDTIEVKEVDLDNGLLEEVYSHLDDIKDTADRMTSGNFMHNKAAITFSVNTIAKVLELMGLKVQKGE